MPETQFQRFGTQERSGHTLWQASLVSVGGRLEMRVRRPTIQAATGAAASSSSVLAPALEGFSPTPEFPEITEAQALLAALE